MLHKITLQPGLDKQSSDTGAEGKWVNADYSRFRYGYPEKIGGWQQLGSETLVGSGRDQHVWVDNDGNRYAAIGTNKLLYIYFEGAFYDITPLDLTRTQASATFTFDGTTSVVITTATAHGAEVGDIILLESVTLPGGTGLTDADFEGKLFEVITTPAATTFTITSSSAGSTATGGSVGVEFYYVIGPVTQGYGYGWGTNTFGGRVVPPTLTTLVGTLADDAFGTGGSPSTDITLTATAAFPTTGTIQIGTELITYTGNNTGTNTITGIARAASGSTRSTHSAAATVYDASSYVGWGSASSSSHVIIEPGQWRLVNFGEKLLALVHNKKVFEWDPSFANLSVRATVVSGAPTASRDMMISTPDRHLVFIGTELTIGTATSINDMLVRFSNQEDINTYTPTATNTAGSQKLPDGSKLMACMTGRTALYIWSDTAMYTMKFIGPPFTFGFDQVGTNCGISSQHASVEIDGIAYWMGPNGFFRFTGGRVQSMLCLVEDYVFNDINTNANQQVHAAVDNIFGEVTWFYCSSGSSYIDRSVTYNYLESTAERPIWYTSSLDRTTWVQQGVYSNPYATEYEAGEAPTVPTIGGVTNGASYFWQHNIGTDEVKATGATTAIQGFVESGDYDISGEGLQGQGELMMRISRVIPDFGEQTGDAKVYLNSKAFPSSTPVSTSYNSTTSTTQIWTRKRARQIALKVGNISTGQSWRMGTFRLDINAGGRR